MGDWTEALGELEEAQHTAEGLAVLRAAQGSGLLDLLAAGTTASGAAAALGVPEGRVGAALEVLRSTGVAQVVDGRWGLTEGWAALVAGDTPFEVGPVLDAGAVRAQQLERALGDVVDYWALSAEDRLSVARGVSFDPGAPSAQAMLRQAVATIEGVEAALDAGGAVLELGCGVASRLTAVLLAFPAATGVGVELDPELVAWGRARGERLGLADRLSLVAADATTWQPDRAFDVVQWSQFFFPHATRAAALATAWRALRPGGWVNMPAVWDGADLDEGSALDRELALERLVLDGWGVPMRATDELAQELTDAGFVDVQVLPTPQIHYVRARCP